MHEHEPSNPLHDISGPNAYWSRTNAAESQPEVHKPLTWDFWKIAAERAMRGQAVDFGILPPREVDVPKDVNRRVWALFYGRVALNVDFFRRMMDLVPGASGADFERDYLGTVRPDVPSYKSRRRYLPIFVKGTLLTLRIESVILKDYHETIAWWKQQVAPQTIADLDGSRERYYDALRRFERVQRNHCANSSIAARKFAELTALAKQVGLPELASKLSVGYGDTEDTRVMTDLWRVSRGQSTLDEFLAHNGYHGPSEGDLSCPSWREDPRPIVALLDKYRALNADTSPVATENKRRQERLTAEEQVLAALQPSKRRKARKLFADAEKFMKLREMGKVSYIRTVDAGRAACNARGRQLVQMGKLDSATDVYYLTAAEAFDRLPTDTRQLVSERKQLFDRYCKLEIPVTWTGNPIPQQPAAEPATKVSVVKGIGVSAGVVEGRVRLVLDQNGVDPMEPGEILVTRTTDPSWGAFFLVAGGLVIDIGGPMSHGAIIAREIGVPCVIGTNVGTRQLQDGDWIRVDGNSGEVTILERQAA